MVEKPRFDVNHVELLKVEGRQVLGVLAQQLFHTKNVQGIDYAVKSSWLSRVNSSRKQSTLNNLRKLQQFQVIVTKLGIC